MTGGVGDGSRNRDLLDWFRRRGRAFPWRERRPDPYRVLVSEFMLQQTQVSRVAPAYGAFLARFPTAEVLAAASKADVIRAWAGLGYNRRAVALSDAARWISSVHRGRVPDGVDDLRRLPGVGPYTAAAVASIAYGVAVPAIDTNVARVVARARLGVEPGEAGAAAIERAAGDWMDRRRPGEWNQAVMDLGRDVCGRRPRCGVCPVAPDCAYERSETRSIRRAPAPAPFAGSDRQVRGAIVRALRRERGAMSLGRLATTTDFRLDRVAACVGTLRSDGLVAAGPAALAGRSAGRVRLADG